MGYAGIWTYGKIAQAAGTVRQTTALVCDETLDRITDRPLWCSQQAVLNVRDEADAVLYLVNAGTDPVDAGYVAPEMKLLTWIGKPVVILLNQTGAFTSPDAEQRDEELWRTGLKDHEVVKDVLGLDAFGRCWVQEGELMQRIRPHLPREKRESFDRLCDAWEQQNLSVFGNAVGLMARTLADSVMDSIRVSEETFIQKIGIGRAALTEELRRGSGKTRGTACREDLCGHQRTDPHA